MCQVRFSSLNFKFNRQTEGDRKQRQEIEGLVHNDYSSFPLTVVHLHTCKGKCYVNPKVRALTYIFLVLWRFLGG